MKLVALPTWIIARAVSPLLPKGHPWRGRRFSLSEWHEGRTPFSMEMDIVMWINLFFLSSLLLSMIFRR